MILLDSVLKAIAFVILGLLEILGWKRASRWLDLLMGESNKDESPVI